MSNKKQKTGRPASDRERMGEAQGVTARGTDSRTTTSKRQDQNELMEEILEAENLKKAYKAIVRNGGAPGIDGITVEDLKSFLAANWTETRRQLLTGTYTPKPVKRVEIPKPGGGTRGLGIPTVLDRFIQQAVMQVLQGQWDATFSNHSFGFRPGRSAHQAVQQAREYIRAGLRYVVDLDLEKFFDRVNHDVLMSRVAKRVGDKRVLGLIRAYLNAGVLANGLVQPTVEGVPQGGPLSPLLSNLLLDELDRELEKRQLHFVRYADDCNIYVASERAGQRVMESVTRFLDKRLRLRVNKEKSAVGKPSSRRFLGFSFGMGVEPKIRLAEQSRERFKRKIQELTRPTRGQSLEQVIQRLRRYLIGWHGYFRICETPSVFQDLDKWINRRLRSYAWRHWERPRRRCGELLRLGVNHYVAARTAISSKGPWRLSSTPGLNRALSNDYLYALGLPRLGPKRS